MGLILTWNNESIWAIVFENSNNKIYMLNYNIFKLIYL